jgi:hypothetical protein
MNKKAEGPEGNPSIAENLRRINRETSLRLAAASAGGASTSRSGRIRILAAALDAFAKSFFLKKNFVRGKKGFIIAGGDAMEALVQAVKAWELAFRRSEGGNLPPVNEAEVDKLSSRYASWTAS